MIARIAGRITSKYKKLTQLILWLSLLLNTMLLIFALLVSYKYIKRKIYYYRQSKRPNVEYLDLNNMLQANDTNAASIYDPYNIYSLQDNSNLKNKKYQTTLKKILPVDLQQKMEQDPYLEIIEYQSDFFTTSALKQYLEKIPSMKIYVLIEFNDFTTYNTISRISSRGYTTWNKIITEYINQKHGIFYGKYYNLKKIAALGEVRKIYILNQYTAKGYYILNLKTEKPEKDINFYYSLPYSKPGKELLEIKKYFNGVTLNIKEKEIINNQFHILLDTTSSPLNLFCQLRYKVNLFDTLKNHIKIAGEMTMQEYTRRMNAGENITIYNTFTRESPKILFTDYIKEQAAKLKPIPLISEKYKSLFNILEEDIQYDWNKRQRFFGGRIVYTNIMNMYMTTAELAEKKIGACPESSSLEAAILRYAGIAVRTATRAAHIFIEVYIPGQGWVTTSASLNEIPLCFSDDEHQVYFIRWEPYLPVRVTRWEGTLYPIISF